MVLTVVEMEAASRLDAANRSGAQQGQLKRVVSFEVNSDINIKRPVVKKKK